MATKRPSSPKPESRMARLGRRLRPRTRGQGLVEFALILPVAALILLLTIDFGRAYFQWITLNNVAKIGANFAALHPDGWSGTGDATVQAAYRSLMNQDIKDISANCPVATIDDPTFPDAAPTTYAVGGHANVVVTCDFHLLTPFITAVFGGNTLKISASADFTIRGGALNGIPIQTAAPTGTGLPTGTPTATPTATATPTSTATLPLVTVSFYGIPRPPNSQGGGPPGSPGEAQVVGLPGLTVDFSNTTTGTLVSCVWDFSDGPVVNSCGGTVAHTFSSATRKTYDVTLTVNGTALARTTYVLIGCQVPSFIGSKKNNASGIWTTAGFAAGNISFMPGNGNYFINTQSVAGGQLNPSGGCTGATITVGP